MLRALKPGWQHQVTPSEPVPPPASSKLGVWICKDSNEEFPGNTTLLGVPGMVFNLGLPELFILRQGLAM